VVSEASGWAARLRWGNRSLGAELVDAHRPRLTFGERPDDAHALGAPGRVELHWSPTTLEVRFTTGVTGQLRRRGDNPQSLGQLIDAGKVQEQAGQFTLTLTPGDSLQLGAGRLQLEVRPAREAITRFSLDRKGLLLLGVLLLAIATVLGSVLDSPKPHLPVFHPAHQKPRK
jgi:hypothetical protein